MICSMIFMDINDFILRPGAIEHLDRPADPNM